MESVRYFSHGELTRRIARQGFGYASRAIATQGYQEKDPATAVVREHVQTYGEETVSKPYCMAA